MRRRDVITMLGGATVFPFGAVAQQQMPVIGFLSSTSPGDWAANLKAFREGLGELGYAEGRNVTITYRWAEYRHERLPGFAADLVQRKVDVIVATGGDNSIEAAVAATKTIPVVFTTGNDPVRAGYVESLNRPGGNATGVTFVASALEAKRLELLHEIDPRAVSVAALTGSSNTRAESDRREIEEAARSLGLQVHFLNAGSDAELEAAFAAIAALRVNALQIVTDPFFYARIARLNTLVAAARIPAIFWSRQFVEGGGLMSYGASLEEAYRKVGRYTGRILQGAKTMELPIEQVDKITLVINLKTAQELGITIPPALLSLADEVIE